MRAGKARPWGCFDEEFFEKQRFVVIEAKGGAAMCEWMERFGAEKEAKGRKEGRKEGLAAGEHGAQCKMARRLLARGKMTPGEVAELTELPLAEVEEIAKGISA